jgi:AraC-like DNA-binding protein
VELYDGEHSLTAGEVLFLRQSDVYRLIPRVSDYSLFNIFFDFGGADVPVSDACVFTELFCEQLCPVPIVLDDAPSLASPACFGGERVFRIAGELCGIDRTAESFPLFVRSLIGLLLCELVSHTAKPSAAERIVEFINSNPTLDLSVSALAARFGYHPSHLNRLVRAHTGCATGEYVRTVRMRYARAAISEGEKAPTEIAAELGYYDYSHFYKAFKREFNVSPTECTSRKKR